MEDLEKKIKEMIISTYGSLSKFAEKVEMPWTTLDSVLKRGINKSNISNVIKICNGLNISADKLAEGEIITINSIENFISDPDIRRIQRARNAMPEKDREKMMKILEASFEDYFEDDTSDDPD